MHFVEQDFGDVRVLAIKGKLTDSPETDQLHEKISHFLFSFLKRVILNSYWI